MDLEISEFIKDNNVATICCTINDEPWCFNCYYVYLETDHIIAFKSSHDTKHAQILLKNNKVSGTILPSPILFTNIKGLQLEGIVTIIKNANQKHITDAYYDTYPIGKNIAGDIYVVSFTTLKYTDNSKGFGYKNNWDKKG